MAKMTIAICQRLSTACAFAALIGYTHARVKRTVYRHISTFVQIVHATVGKFDLRLVHDILIRPIQLSDAVLPASSQHSGD